ncbi:isocitrate dehydrogenase (NAD(+)) [Clostridium botulinum]|uniref:isocitrate dehydrogenase (NAD(+)) n=1 Tax=Clostridium botulinum TaxID=1491 RepID=UPI0006A4B3C1|nr:isocitrate dehydrogenase (NAD(+)) [Clostridium botulinum]KOC35733.1 isocitrate dehydrogenase [Clostridium botulinum]
MVHNVTLIPGDGIGPEITLAAKKIIESTGVDINWDIVEAGEKLIPKEGTPLPEYVIKSIKKNKVALKGPITTPVGKGFKSVNVRLRQALDLYANVRPVKTYKGVFSRYENVNLIIVRENTEGLYLGIEHKVGDFAAESIKIITKKASDRIVKFAFELARKNGREKVMAVHKANIMKLSDGLFLKCARKIAENYNDIEFNDMIVDAMSMKLVQNPEKYDVLVMPNLYGDILSDMASGLVGGLGIVPGANIGNDIAVFEAVHGSAPDIAGKNIANPTAILLSGVMMLKHLGEFKAAEQIDAAITKVLEEGKVITQDLGGVSTTSKFVEEIIKNL